MKTLIFWLCAMFFALNSCTLEKTDYEAETSAKVSEFAVFSEAASLSTGNYKVSIEALNGTFYKGYNKIRLKITNISTNTVVNSASVNFLPIMTLPNGNKKSCPHQYALNFTPSENYFSGYAVFTNESSGTGDWEVYVNFVVNNQAYSVNKGISVKQQTNLNLNMTAFTGNDGEEYYIALISPQKPKVAENPIVAGIYKYNKPAGAGGTFPDPSQFSFSKVSNYTLKIDPRMPDPSMGNHSSPNNKDLTQKSDGLYHGIVNYTMTGNWTLNFILLKPNGNIVKGTVVPQDFTPGVQGAKSELYIDTLF